MDKLIEICDELERKNSKCDIKKVRDKLEEYIGNDYDKILQLRAEIEKHKNYEEKNITHYSLFFSVFSVIMGASYNVYSIYKELTTGNSKIVIGILIVWISISLIAAVILIYIICNICEKIFNYKRDNWISYISVVLNDIEKKFQIKKSRYVRKKRI